MAGIELTLEDEPVRAAKNVQPLAVGQAGEGHVHCSAKATAMAVGLETDRTIGMPARPAF